MKVLLSLIDKCKLVQFSKLIKAGSHWTDFDRKKRNKKDAIENQAWQNGALRKLTKAQGSSQRNLV